MVTVLKKKKKVVHIVIIISLAFKIACVALSRRTIHHYVIRPLSKGDKVRSISLPLRLLALLLRVPEHTAPKHPLKQSQQVKSVFST